MSDSIISNLSYTNKDFNTIYPELLDLVKKLTYKWDPSISNESDPGVILLKLNALIADKCNYNSDKNVLECFPLSVTQEANARQLYEQIGYYMHWYQSALVKVYLTFNNTDSEYTSSDYALIPPFTSVSDSDNNLVYTLLGISGDFIPTNNNKLVLDGTTLAFDAIQGVPVQYSINDETVITAAHLDSDNRIYFSTSDIAENGIFITHRGQNDYSSWIRKDNLYVENLGNTFYKFGILPGSETPYIEFPEDAETILGNGIEITYIRTAADEGIIPALYLEKFSEDLTATAYINSADTTLVLNSDNVVLTNYANSSGGADKESISEAYKGYQSVVGTYNTLITLRDYINACLQSELCSNAIVTDRRNDIQCSYSVISTANGVDTPITVIEEDSDKNSVLTAFDIKLYILQYAASNINTGSLYNQTFDLLENSYFVNITANGTAEASETDSIREYIEDQKSISHDYQPILTPDIDNHYSHICLFKNKYPLSMRISTKYVLTDSEIADVKTAILQQLYSQLNSKELEFGEFKTVSELEDIILDADSRISDVTIYDITYETYALYWNGEAFKEVALQSTDTLLVDYSNTSYLTAVTPISTFAIYRETPDYSEDSTYNKDYITKYNDALYICLSDDVTGTWDSSYWSLVNDYDDETDYAVGDICAYDGYIYRCIIATKGDWNSSNWVVISTNDLNEHYWNFFKFRYMGEDTWYQYNVSTEEYDITWTSTEIQNYFFTWSGTLTTGDEVIIEISPASQFRNEIYVKSILAGVTPLFIRDDSFNYDINQGVPEVSVDVPIQNIEKIRTNVDINITNESNTYTLKDNENIQLFAPNLIEGVTYSNYVKYDFCLGDSVYSIPADSNYELQEDEWIAFYWKDSEQDESLYQYYIYEQGNIICPSFPLYQSNSSAVDTSQELVDNVTPINVSKDGGTQYIISSTRCGDMSYSQSEDIAENLSQYLSGSKTITAKYINQITLDESTSLYWSLSTEDNGSFVLFNVVPSGTSAWAADTEYEEDDIVSYTDDNGTAYWICLKSHTSGSSWDGTVTVDEVEYTESELWSLSEYSQRILQSGEYIFYTNNELTQFNILGSGTKIIKYNDGYEWSVDVIDLDVINSFGSASLTDNWFVIPTGTSTIVQEQQFVAISPTCIIQLVENDGADFDITFNSTSIIDLSNYTISYSTDGGTSYNELPSITATSSNISGWSGRSSLSVNCGPDNEQILLANQSIEVYTSGSDEGTAIEGKDYDGDKLYYPVVLQFTNEVNTEGAAGDIYITSTDESDNTIYNTLYIYSKYTNTDTVKYASGGGAALYFAGGSTISGDAVTFTFDVPTLEDSTDGYLLPVTNPYSSDISALRFYLDNELLYDFTGTTYDFAETGTYYIKLPIISDGPHVIESYMTNTSTNTKVITLGRLFKYRVSEDIIDNDKYDLFIDLITNVFDTNNLYNYTYEIEEEDLIEDPLSAESFFNHNHIYNDFTISQVDLSDISIVIPKR